MNDFYSHELDALRYAFKGRYNNMAVNKHRSSLQTNFAKILVGDLREKYLSYFGKEIKMKKEKVVIDKVKFYGYSLLNKHKKKIMFLGYDHLIDYINENNLGINVPEIPHWNRKQIIEAIIERTGTQDVTVCLVLDTKGNWARGVTVWNRDLDVYNFEIGQKEAQVYAERALKKREIKRNLFKREEVVETLMRSRCPWVMKGGRNPELSFYERKLLFGKGYMEKGKTQRTYINWGECYFKGVSIPMKIANYKAVGEDYGYVSG